MQNLLCAYVDECRQAHVQPFHGFIEHVASCAVDASLDDVSVATIALFARAMLRTGTSTLPGPHHTAPGDARRMPGPHRMDVRAAAPSTASTSAARLVAMCLHHRASASSSGQGHESSRHPHTRPLTQSAGASVRQARAEEKDITAPSQRAVLKLLLDGVRVVTLDSRDCLHTFVLSGLPLDTVPQSAARLMRVLPACTNLRVLTLNGCGLGSGAGRANRLGQALFTVLTASSPAAACASGAASCAFPHLEVASFADCGLTDAEGARGVRALLSSCRDGAARQQWQQSLRSAPPPARPARTTDDGTDAASSAALPRDEDGVASGRGVRHLDLSGNALSTLTLRALQHALLDDKSLLTLDLSRNRCSTQAIAAFLHSGTLERCQLQSIDLSHNSDATTSTTGLTRLRTGLPTTPTTADGAAPACPPSVAVLFACIHTPAQHRLLYLRRTSHAVENAPSSPLSMGVRAHARGDMSGDGAASLSGNALAPSSATGTAAPSSPTTRTTARASADMEMKGAKTEGDAQKRSGARAGDASARPSAHARSPSTRAHGSHARATDDVADPSASAASSQAQATTSLTTIHISPASTTPTTPSSTPMMASSHAPRSEPRERVTKIDHTDPFPYATPRATLSPTTGASPGAPSPAAAQPHTPTTPPSHPAAAYPNPAFLGSYCIPIVPYGTGLAPPIVPWGWSPTQGLAQRSHTAERGTQTRADDCARATVQASPLDTPGKHTATQVTTVGEPKRRQSEQAASPGPFDPLLASTSAAEGGDAGDEAKSTKTDADATNEAALTVQDLLASSSSPAPAMEVIAAADARTSDEGAVVPIRRLSDAEERRFLLSLVSRVEAFENELTEKLEHHYQQTNQQTVALKRDLLIRLSGLSDDHKAAVQRLQAQQEATAAAIEDALTAKHAYPEQDMMDSLVDLIQTGIQRINDRMRARDSEEEAEGEAGASRAPPSSTGLAGVPTSIFGFRDAPLRVGSGAEVKAPAAAANTEKDFLQDVNRRLQQLGW